MRRATAMVSALALVAFTVALSAQAKPNFSGKWTIVMDPAAAPAAPPAGAPAGGGGGGQRGGGGGRGGAVSGMEVTLTQDATSLKVDKMQGQNPLSLTFKLDGSESKNMMPGRGGAAGAEQVSKAMWDGNKIKITTTGQNGDTVQVLSMDGANLKVETTPAGATAAITTNYKKG